MVPFHLATSSQYAYSHTLYGSHGKKDTSNMHVEKLGFSVKNECNFGISTRPFENSPSPQLFTPGNLYSFLEKAQSANFVCNSSPQLTTPQFQFCSCVIRLDLYLTQKDLKYLVQLFVFNCIRDQEKQVVLAVWPHLRVDCAKQAFSLNEKVYL